MRIVLLFLLLSDILPHTSPIALPTAPPTVKKTQILRLEVTSDENVKDPEVKKKVLEKVKSAVTQCDDVQIQQILKMKGLDGNATLSWRNQSDGNVLQKYQENNITQQICH
ncbi:hypothetical protein IRJ41_018509 [Triplophysa rosa]|uniref:Uncharacterized protein n=1 Tax=Triplophysa rosa TaxID=992332 RepID=A0A9W8CCI8_TRIRA|nr:hypothetical protein IRJ41_018509 [Triplophysa rosa]